MLKIIKNRLIQIKCKKPLIWNSVQLLYGFFLTVLLRMGNKKNTFIFLVSGNIGDTYVYYSCLQSYLNQNAIKDYIIAGNAKGMSQLLDYFHYHPISCIVLSRKKIKCLNLIIDFIGDTQIHMLPSLNWDILLKKQASRTGHLTPFTYLDNYAWINFNLNQKYQLITPTIKNCHAFDANVVQGKTIFINSESDFVKPLHGEIWAAIGKTLMQRGYKVLIINCNGKSKTKMKFGMPVINVGSIDDLPLIQYAGNIISLYSSGCHFLSTLNCKIVLLYPRHINNLKRDTPRLDKDFRILNNKTYFSIEAPFIKDIYNDEPIDEEVTNFSLQHIRFFRQLEKIFPECQDSSEA